MGVFVHYHDDGSKELNACIRFLLHMVYLKPKHKLLLFTDNMYEINMNAYNIYNGVFLVNLPLLPSLAFPFPFAWVNRPLYLLGDPSSYDRGANIHPLSSLVNYQLSFPCCLNHPEDTPWIKLHVYIDDITTSVWYSFIFIADNCWNFLSAICCRIICSSWQPMTKPISCTVHM